MAKSEEINVSRSIAPKTIKSLFAHSGNMCAFPGCNQVLAYNEDLNVSNICHIYGLKPNSARYDKEKDVDFLNSESNLILLCPTHHTLVDKDQKHFTVETLLAMKASWESYVEDKLNSCIAYNVPDVVYDLNAILQYCIDEIGLYEVTLEEVEKEIRIFSKQSHDVKIVMMKILDVVAESDHHSSWSSEGYDFNMMSVVNELSASFEQVASIAKYLMDRQYIAEFKYTGHNIQSFVENVDGSYSDLSNNYGFRMEFGEWSVIRKGRIIDAAYRTHGSL